MQRGIFLWGLLIGALSGCSSLEQPSLEDFAQRLPASVAPVGRLEFSDLTPLVVQENHPESFFVFQEQDGLQLANQGVAPLEATFSCDAPFLFQVGARREAYPGPSQVRFSLEQNSRMKANPNLFFSKDVSECRLFLKDARTPGQIYGIRLVPQHLKSETSGKAYPMKTH